MRYRAPRARAASAAVALTVFAGLASAAPALAETPSAADAPTVVEDGAYPDAAQILADKGITLTRGDGGITLADCTQPGGYQIKVLARTALEDDGDIICFAAPGATGYLAFTIPDAYRITTYNRSVRASLSTDQKPTETTDVPANGTKGIGESLDPKAHAVLLELRVTGSTVTPPTGQPDPASAFAAHLAVGDQGRTCTGALVDRQWILTAKSCFADDPSNPGTVTAGAPKQPTTATIGRTDLNATGGHQTRIIELAPHQDRDLVLARLDVPADGIAPIALATTAAAAGGTLTAAGYGRTATEWAPGKLHAPAAIAGAVVAAGFDLTPTAPGLICKGDAGGPIWSTENGKAALVGVISRSWRGGCLDTPATETRTGAYAARTDGLAAWVTSAVATGGVVVKSDTKLQSGQSITGADLKLTMQADGNLVLTHRQVNAGVLWSSGTSGNKGAWAYVQPDGNFVVYKSDGNQSAGTGALWASNTWGQSGAFLKLRDDGSLAVVKADGSAALWSTGATRLDPKLNSDTKIKTGQWFQSQTAVVEMQEDGNLVRYRRADAEPTWNTNTSGNKGAWAHVQPDGNFVVYKSDANPSAGTGALWGSNTWGQSGAFLKLQDDGGLVLYKKGAAETAANSVWSSGTFRPVSQLAAGQQVYAKTTRLAMQWDGDLVLYRLSDNTVLWHSNTAGNNYASLRIQADGNAIVSSADGNRSLWATGTFWSAGAYLKLQDDGNLVVYKADGGEGIGNAIWATNTLA
ncbi:trypsin-like serine protease [Kitasatospora sp. NPDC096204]|uniref:trypsin-like serine protease n=1 Tax=Kitasatospora sp. NPDC096204 TaxID=3364094 RepID=UPI0037F9EED0